MTESFFVRGFGEAISNNYRRTRTFEHKSIGDEASHAPIDSSYANISRQQGRFPSIFAVRFNLSEVTAGKEGRITREWLQDIYEKAKNDFIIRGNSSTDYPSGAHLRSSSKIIEEALSTPNCDWCGEDCDFKYFCMKEVFKNERAELESGAGCHKVVVSGF